MTTAWDPRLYLRFSGERERPFWELVARIPSAAPQRVVDLGCGPGTATAGLCARWPAATILGVDHSPQMIEQATPLAQEGRLSFQLADLRDWHPDGGPDRAPDVIVSNAALQWVPGHVELLGRWMSCLAPGGVLAFGVPGNFDAPSHTLLRQLAGTPSWAGFLENAREPGGVLDPGQYLDLLAGPGARVDAWETTYQQVLSGPDPVFTWVRATALRPYLARLDGDQAARFSEQYRAALAAAYPPDTRGNVVFPFRRVFVVAQAATS
jgi:trans-aconitate 2-methyltransferase